MKCLKCEKEFEAKKSEGKFCSKSCSNSFNNSNVRYKKIVLSPEDIKVCRVCNKEKKVTEFHQRKNSIDGYRNDCKDCLNKKCLENPNRKLNKKNYYNSNAEKIKEKSRKWIQENKELSKESRRKYQKDNKDKRNKYSILNDGEKMSKTKGNVINPDDYDSDELRFYMMFIGHYFDGGSWSDKNISGIKRFINRFKEWMSREGEDVIDIEPFKNRIFSYTESFKFNKVVSEFMVLVNQYRTKNITPEIKQELISIIKIYMPTINI